MTRGGNDGCEAAWRSWLETARSGGRCAHCGSRTLAPSGLERAAAFASPAGSALGSAFASLRGKGHGPSVKNVADSPCPFFCPSLVVEPLIGIARPTGRRSLDVASAFSRHAPSFCEKQPSTT